MHIMYIYIYMYIYMYIYILAYVYMPYSIQNSPETGPTPPLYIMSNKLTGHVTYVNESSHTILWWGERVHRGKEWGGGDREREREKESV